MAFMENKSADELLQIARLADQIERYEDMVKAMKQFVVLKKSLDKADHRNLLSVAYKNVVGTRRSAWRALSNENEDQAVVKEYREKIKEELNQICTEVIKLLDDYLLEGDTSDRDPAATVFYQKMKGDYYRYLAEVAGDDEKAECVKNSCKAYEAASETCDKSLNPTHPICLGLALNFSVFYYEIANEKEKACKLAKEAFDKAIGELENVDEDNYKDSTLIMQLLRDNLTLWTASDEGNGGMEDEEPNAN